MWESSWVAVSTPANTPPTSLTSIAQKYCDACQNILKSFKKSESEIVFDKAGLRATHTAKNSRI